MTDRPPDLPDYHQPPIDELAIGVQFPQIQGMYDAHVGLFWQTVRESYPRAESQPRIEAPLESAGEQIVQPQVFSFNSALPPQGRTWLISESDDYLIQVQNTRFFQNWRRRQAEYRHFEELWNLFVANFGKFKELLRTEHLPLPMVQQIEVNYINWIIDLDSAEFLNMAQSANIRAYEQDRQPNPLTVIARYDLNDEPIERLYIQSQPALRRQDPVGQGTQFSLVYRATNVEGLSDDEMRRFANAGRSIIVNAFTDLTTSAAHERWGRFQ
jgi:uncharacterized protein (TIGR04255 family)